MSVLRTLARIFGWLLTPLVAWAASFLGGVAGSAVALLLPSPRAGLILTVIMAAATGTAALWLWLRLLRRSPELRERLQVTEEGSPVAVDDDLAGLGGAPEDPNA